MAAKEDTFPFDEERDGLAYPHLVSEGTKNMTYPGNEARDAPFSPFFPSDTVTSFRGRAGLEKLGARPPGRVSRGRLRGARPVSFLLCGSVKVLWIRSRRKDFTSTSARIALFPHRTGRPVHLGAVWDPPFTNSTSPHLRPATHLTPPSTPHERRRVPRNRYPPGAATNANDILRSPTYPYTIISDHSARYRSRQRPLGRTCPPLLERC